MKRKLFQKDQEYLERITCMVAGALKDTINAHGPVTNKSTSSAAKKISN
jgi:hypothetical protein